MINNYIDLDIARYLLNSVYTDHKSITNIRLQTFLYYAHEMYKYNYDELLLKNKFKFLENGPIIEDVFDEYKKFGDYPIEEKENKLRNSCKKIPEKIKDYLDHFYSFYHKYSTIELRNGIRKDVK